VYGFGICGSSLTGGWSSSSVVLVGLSIILLVASVLSIVAVVCVCCVLFAVTIQTVVCTHGTNAFILFI